MNAARRCSLFLNRDLAALCAPSRGAPAAKRPLTPGGVSAAGQRYPEAGGDGGGAGSGGPKPLGETDGASSTVTAARAVCQMGGSSSRLFGTLAQPELFPDQEANPEPEDLTGAPADQLLRECEEALRSRPARPHRDLVYPSSPLPRQHSRNPCIRVMQWNILAQALGEGKDGFVRCPPEALDWRERKYLILEEILTYRPDVLCLQEVDHYHDTFQPVLARLGYQGSFLAKPRSPCLDVASNNGPDGCALFYRSSRLQPLGAPAHLRLAAALLPTNQVAIAQTFCCRVTGRRLCVAVTHLKARSGWERLRSAQGADLLRRLHNLTAPEVDSGIPLVVCGDFNAEPSEDVYRRFGSSPLGLDSAYKLLSVDGGTEPDYTTWKIRPSGESRSTLDYIWYSRRALSVETLLELPSEEQIGPDRLPSYHYPSDHLSLLCDLSFREPLG